LQDAVGRDGVAAGQGEAVGSAGSEADFGEPAMFPGVGLFH
jgi:hypothetical protein